MATVEDFTRRHRLASARIVEGLGRVQSAKEDFTATVMRSVPAVVNAPGDEAGRAREAVRLVGPSIEAIEWSLEEQTPEIMAAVAELSQNWEEHKRLWDSLGRRGRARSCSSSYRIYPLKKGPFEAAVGTGRFLHP